MKRSAYLLIILLVVIALTACSNSGSSSGTSSLSFGIMLKGAPGAPSLAPITCGGTTGISTVEALLYDRNGNIIRTGGPWPCADHQGTITGITASNQNYSMKLVLTTRDSAGYIKYSGDTGNTLSITTAGANVDAGTVILTPFMAWSINTLNGSGSVGKHSSIATSSTGTVYMVYSDATNSVLRCVTNRTGVWVDAVIDSGNVGQFPSMVLDATGKTYVSYYDFANKDLKLATNATGTWVATTIDNSGNDVGQESSIAIDGAGKLHISYYDATSKTLKYATNVTDSWVISTVDANPDTGKYSSIAATAANNVHIAYYDVTNGNLNYAKWGGTSWTVLPVDSTGDVGQYPSLALDAVGNVHISYFDASTTNGSLKYLMITPAGATTMASIDAGANLYPPVNTSYYYIISYGKRTSLKIDASGYVHIGYSGSRTQHYSSYDYQTEFFQKYATNASGTWITYTVETVATTGYNTSASDIGRGMLAIDSSRNVHLSYWDLANNRLKYATNAASAWSTYTLDMLGNVGQYTSIAANSTGKASISYYDATYGVLKFATNTSGAWVATPVDSGTVGQYSSLALTGTGSARIAYFDSSKTHLKFASNALGSWATATVDSGANVGKYASLALDSLNNAHVSYYDTTTGDLKYATNASGSWVLAAVDQLTDLGYHTSMAVGPANKQYISYSTADGKLKLATNAAGSWTASTVDSGTTTTQNQFQNTSIKVDSTGKVYISYYDAINGDLKFATRPSGTTVWSVGVIDSAGTVGQYSSLALDTNRRAHISYYDVSRKTLRYATNYSGSWLTYTLDSQGSGGDVGQYSSIFVDTAGKIHISYYDAVNGRLKYATTSVGSGGVLADQDVPSVPTGLAAVSADRNTINLSWTASTDNSSVSGYKIYRDGDVLYYASTTTTNYSNTSLNPYEQHCYEVTAFDGNNNESARSAQTCARTMYMNIAAASGNYYAGSYASMALDSLGLAHIAHTDGNNNFLLTVQDGLGSWSTTTVATGGNKQDLSIAVDSSNVEHISYFDQTSYPDYNLRYATTILSSWTVTVVDPRTSAGYRPSISLDSGEKPHITYYYNSVGLFAATNAPGSWTTTTIDASVSNAGQQSTSKMDSANKLHVAYTISSTIMYATDITGSWATTTVDASANNNASPLIAVDSSQKAHIVYSQQFYDGVAWVYRMVYSTNASGSWSAPEVIASSTSAQVAPLSMVRDSSNKLHIVYRDYSGANYALMYATNSSGTWQTYVIDPVYVTYGSIAVDSSNKPRIAYQSGSVLQYAWIP